MPTIDLTELEPHFGGDLITPAHGERYHQARAVFNAMFDRRPALIARVSTIADVVAVLAFARKHAHPIAVRGGGHSVAGYSSIDDGVVIDLSQMKAIHVDVEAKRVRVQGGASWGEIDRATQQHGLATTGGRVTSTGVAGFTLGSGSGWLERLHGLACDNLVSAQVVTADGTLLTASATENEELFWGLRGGGGNFGIVTEFELRLHPIGPILLGGLIMYPRDQAPELCRFYREYMKTAPLEVGGGLVMMCAPPAPFVPPALQGKPVVTIIVAYFGAVERGAEVLAPLRAFGAPAVDLVQPMPYLAFQTLLDAGNPFGRRNYWRSDNIGTLADDTIDALIACAATVTSPHSIIVLGPMGGAIAAVPDVATPLGGRTAPWMYHCYGVWTDKDDARHIAWVRATEQALRPWCVGRVSLNFISEANDERVRAAFGEDKYRRLAALKDRYDPQNVFRMNQNIRPTKAA